MNLSENPMYIWSRAPRPPPLPPPPWSMVQDAPPPVGWGVGQLFPLWGGCGGFWGFGLLSLGVKRYKASSRQGLREGLGVGSFGLTVYVLV